MAGHVSYWTSTNEFPQFFSVKNFSTFTSIHRWECRRPEVWKQGTPFGEAPFCKSRKKEVLPKRNGKSFFGGKHRIDLLILAGFFGGFSFYSFSPQPQNQNTKNISPRSLRARPSKMVVGRQAFPIGKVTF